MWQFSLYFQKDLFFYIKDLQEYLLSACKNQNCCIRIFAREDQFVLLIALPKKVYEKQILSIKNKIIDIIFLYFKPKMIMQSIENFSIEKSSNKILIDILSSFERQAETEKIFERLSLCDKLFLDSFVQFKLVDLTKNWQEMAKLINQNTNFLEDENIKFDLMRFLMSGVSTNVQEIELSKIDSSTKVTKDGKTVKNFDQVFYNSTENDKLMHTIISTYPKVIKINSYQNFDANFVNDLYSLFGERLKLLE